MESFVLIAKVGGEGYPFTNFLLQSKKDSENSNGSYRTPTIEKFPHVVKEHISSLTPRVFFTDKDKGQIKAIRNVFNIIPTISLWHLTRAIKSKMKELQKYDSAVTEELQASVLKLISNHYNQHPLISPELQGRSFEIIQEEYNSQLCTLLANNGYFFQYLLSTW